MNGVCGFCRLAGGQIYELNDDLAYFFVPYTFSPPTTYLLCISASPDPGWSMNNVFVDKLKARISTFSPDLNKGRTTMHTNLEILKNLSEFSVILGSKRKRNFHT